MSTVAQVQLEISEDAKVQLEMSGDTWVRLGISTDSEVLKYENGCFIMVKYALYGKNKMEAPERLCDRLHQLVTYPCFRRQKNRC